MVIGTSKSRKKVSLDWSKENTKHVCGSEDEEMFFVKNTKLSFVFHNKKKLQTVMPVYFPHCSKRIQTKMK